MCHQVTSCSQQAGKCEYDRLSGFLPKPQIKNIRKQTFPNMPTDSKTTFEIFKTQKSN